MTMICIYHQSIGPDTNPTKRLELDNLLYSHILTEQKQQPVICCGDFNVPASEKDLSIKRPWGDINFSKLREVFNRFLKNSKLADPGAQHHVFSWYPNPLKKNQMLNQGMRIDYILPDMDMHTSELSTLSYIAGSDHKPVTLTAYSKNIP